MSGISLSPVLLFTIVNLVLSSPVPDKVGSKNVNTVEVANERSVYLEHLHDNVYRILLPDRTGNLLEQIVEETGPGQFTGMDDLKRAYSGPAARLIVTSQTGPNSYSTRYTIVPKELQLPAPAKQ
ncbi:uncharacterized protein Dvir_GJ26643 [Drosophila virilis]|uniref:Uncharacterized protein n=1 Tax=Drosophila virilis TaxID=7244 RepID=A0A0Q9WU71_DROVI|nr:uncharacterized protein LOC26531413 [Drosophila virilis]KRF84719.1 uncharacterized protein Dvir_GJ26643 [Drosophila virilis]